MLYGINLAATLMFAVVTTFTPGPNNITSASMGVLHGYRRTLPFLLGIFTGFVALMLICGLVSTALYAVLPGVERWLRCVGALYILWLAWHVLVSSYQGGADQQVEALGYGRGLGLVLLNPKVIVYGLTMYGTFLAPLTGAPGGQIVSALALACLAFGATSAWTLFGSVIHIWLRKPAIERVINTALALLLVYTAADLSGLLKLLRA